jgi:hypothetical protein
MYISFQIHIKLLFLSIVGPSPQYDLLFNTSMAEPFLAETAKYTATVAEDSEM